MRAFDQVCDVRAKESVLLEEIMSNLDTALYIKNANTFYKNL